MSPRSAEFLHAARRRAAAAKAVIDDDPATALSAAYYSMLYVARAALSERDTAPKTHAGTWHEFRRAFGDSDRFDFDLFSAVQGVQPERERADYEAWLAPKEEAQRVIELADRFLVAVEAVLEEPPQDAG